MFPTVGPEIPSFGMNTTTTSTALLLLTSTMLSNKREMFYIISPFVVVLYSWSSLQIFLYSSYFLWLHLRNQTHGCLQ